MTVVTILKTFCKQHVGPIAGYIALLFIGTLIGLVGITKVTAKLYKSIGTNDQGTAFKLLFALLILTITLTATNWSIDYVENRMMPRFHEFVRGKVTNDIIDANETNLMTNTNALRFRAYVSATTRSTTHIFNNVVKQYIPNLIMTLVLIGFLMYLSPSYGATFLVSIGVIAGLFALNRKTMMKNSKQVEMRIRYADTFAFDIFKNLETVVARGQIEPEKEAIAEKLKAAAALQIESNQKFDNISYILNGILIAAIFITMALAIRKLGGSGNVEKITFAVMTCVTLVGKLKTKMSAITNTNLSMVQSFGEYSANHLADVAEYVAPPAGRFSVCADSNWCATTLEFRDVGFTYAGTSRPVFQHFSWKIGPRGVYCLRAPSGSGKSTLAKIVLRVFDPTEGAILLNDKDIRTVAINDLRSKVVLLNQEINFLERTIREILCFGMGDKCPSDTKTQQVWDSMKDMFEGLTLDSNIGSDGNKLSTGMKAMLRFNAALLSNASVIICDEPTNGLSPMYKQQVLQVIQDMAINKCVLLITHDQATADIAQDISHLPVRN